MQLLLVHCTCPDENCAQELGRELVKRQLAACVSLSAIKLSIFPWENRICEEPEILLEIKTTHDRYPDLEMTLNELHPYEVPQIIALPIDTALNSYHDWVVENTRRHR